MGDHTKRRGSETLRPTDDAALSRDELLDLINQTEQTVERAPKATIKGMPPLVREPAGDDPA